MRESQVFAILLPCQEDWDLVVPAVEEIQRECTFSVVVGNLQGDIARYAPTKNASFLFSTVLT